jgi:hypothetical protein
MTCTPVRSRLRETPIRCKLRGILHAYEVHTCEVHANEIHAYEVHTRDVYAYEIHTREMHAHETPGYEMPLLTAFRGPGLMSHFSFSAKWYLGYITSGILCIELGKAVIMILISSIFDVDWC